MSEAWDLCNEADQDNDYDRAYIGPLSPYAKLAQTVYFVMAEEASCRSLCRVVQACIPTLCVSIGGD